MVHQKTYFYQVRLIYNQLQFFSSDTHTDTRKTVVAKSNTFFTQYSCRAGERVQIVDAGCCNRVSYQVFTVVGPY